MKKLAIILLSVYVLSACQTTGPLDANGEDDSGLGLRSSESAQSTNEAANINTQLGAGYIGNGNYERALLKLNKALQQDPYHALAHNYMGVLYGRLERPQKARQAFKTALKLAPNNSSILNNYAVFLCEQKDFEQAVKYFRKVTNNPLYANRAIAYQSAGRCAFENNKLELSETLYRKALELSDNSPQALLGLAKVNYKNANYEYAWSYFERFYKVSAPDADGLWLGINILKQLTQPDKNLLSSFELQLKSKYPDSDETKWFYQGKQEY